MKVINANQHIEFGSTQDGNNVRSETIEMSLLGTTHLSTELPVAVSTNRYGISEVQLRKIIEMSRPNNFKLLFIAAIVCLIFFTLSFIALALTDIDPGSTYRNTLLGVLILSLSVALTSFATVAIVKCLPSKVSPLNRRNIITERF